jgi:hypothetical protein
MWPSGAMHALGILGPLQRSADAFDGIVPDRALVEAARCSTKNQRTETSAGPVLNGTLRAPLKRVFQ